MAALGGAAAEPLEMSAELKRWRVSRFMSNSGPHRTRPGRRNRAELPRKQALTRLSAVCVQVCVHVDVEGRGEVLLPLTEAANIPRLCLLHRNHNCDTAEVPSCTSLLL